VNWKGDFQQGVVECNLGDLPLILVGFLKAETTFLSHLPIIPAHFGHPQGLGVFATFCGLVLNLAFLDEQFAFSKLTMQNQATKLPIHDCNLIYGYGRSSNPMQF
jgi:hypothetical protein